MPLPFPKAIGPPKSPHTSDRALPESKDSSDSKGKSKAKVRIQIESASEEEFESIELKKSSNSWKEKGKDPELKKSRGSRETEDDKNLHPEMNQEEENIFRRLRNISTDDLNRAIDMQKKVKDGLYNIIVFSSLPSHSLITIRNLSLLLNF
jgi:hypothetical protein